MDMEIFNNVTTIWPGWNNLTENTISRKLFDDVIHSLPDERRLILFGFSLENRVLMIVFKIRSDRVRIITARPASKKERKIYGK